MWLTCALGVGFTGQLTFKYSAYHKYVFFFLFIYFFFYLKLKLVNLLSYIYIYIYIYLNIVYWWFCFLEGVDHFCGGDEN